MRVNVVSKKRISTRELKDYLYPTEDLWFLIALIVSIPILLLFSFLMFYSFVSITFSIGILFLSYWLLLTMARANLIANAVKVSNKNFGEVQKVVNEVKSQLNYKKEIEVFVIEEGSVNAFFAKFFQTRYIILNSELLIDMLNEDKRSQLKWVIARFVGSLKVKHLRFEPVKILIEAIESLKVFNLFFLPYERSTQYSGDNIGLIVCGNLKNVMQAFDKFMVGNNLAKYVNLAGMIDQSKDSHYNVFVALNRWFSAYPHITDRYLNLLAFARWKYPKQFYQYISDLDQVSLNTLSEILPDYYNELIEAEEPRKINISLNPSTDARRRIKIYKRV